MKRHIVFLIFSVCFLLEFGYIDSIKREKPKCNQPINMYEALQCKPKFSTGGKVEKLCPDCYDCSHINPDRKCKNKCYYRGKYYKIDTAIDNSAVLPNCYAGCFCNNDLNFVCAVFDCAPPYEIPENCHYVYGLNTCCPRNHTCPDTDLFKCNVNGKTVSQGQTYVNPKDKCSICECQPGVTGNVGDPHCIKNPCSIELEQSSNILKYCAPVYDSLTDCCPRDYMCPSKNDSFDSCTTDVDPKVTCNKDESCKQCRYGNSCYTVGTKLSRNEKHPYDVNIVQNTDCECVIPPYFTCTRTTTPVF